MSLASRVANPSLPPKLIKCPVALLFPSLDNEEASALHTMMVKKDIWPNKRLSEELADEGYTVSARAIQRHRAGDCACE